MNKMKEVILGKIANKLAFDDDVKMAVVLDEMVDIVRFGVMPFDFVDETWYNDTDYLLDTVKDVIGDTFEVIYKGRDEDGDLIMDIRINWDDVCTTVTDGDMKTFNILNNIKAISKDIIAARIHHLIFPMTDVCVNVLLSTNHSDPSRSYETEFVDLITKAVASVMTGAEVKQVEVFTEKNAVSLYVDIKTPIQNGAEWQPEELKSIYKSSSVAN